ncbi:hypothetical protein DERF_015005 [Dermatophagoides farinae]|uniref:Uncharacterized protein n=1 Tax=Dermatophagoides farinae TaxID=6954 RepID=A0A922HNJ3_DERFA|nr:hypothetical protein DERF_015005 [Dermatophagoides farinae]
MKCLNNIFKSTSRYIPSSSSSSSSSIIIIIDHHHHHHRHQQQRKKEKKFNDLNIFIYHFLFFKLIH